ncbi:protein kinase [Streptomyces sp. NPDC021356]|uniref:serine/threonine-protein kinase n=1 Tax=Streptomyces sp. NPDC021356 TaxID=3154900 RepID=UPI0033C0E901
MSGADGSWGSGGGDGGGAGTDVLPRGFRIGGWEVAEPIGTGGWATVYAGRPALGSRDGGAVAPDGDAASRDGDGAAPDGDGAAQDGDGGAERGAGQVGGGRQERTAGQEWGVGRERDAGRERGVGRERDAGRERGGGDGTVALKVLPTAGLAPRQARKVAETARRELELGRRAGHPRLIRVLDCLVLTAPDHPALDGAIVLVMERAERSLRDLLGTGPDEAEAARVVREVCEGLAHLHGAGWVHGDLKPDNVLLGADGSARLSDFGLATELTGAHGTHGYAPPMGTLDYLPPERWRAPVGEHGVRVRPSADVWALGILIHEVFARGASPFPGATPAARSAAAQEYAAGRAPLRMDNAVPPFWRELAADCLAPTHAARAGHTAESLLRRIAERRPALPRSDRGGRRRPRGVLAAVSVSVCVAVAVGVGVAVWAFAGRDEAAGRQAAVADRPAGSVRVFNVDQRCRGRTDRSPQCSLGLAIDPLRPYTIDNVVPTRVWNGDVLAVDCRLDRGTSIIDEADERSAQWFQVRLPRGSTRPTAWLPAVRTKDRPAVPACPRPTTAR